MSELLDAVKIGDTSSVADFLQTPSIRINVRDENGCSPLWIAAREGHLLIAQMLLEHPDSDCSYLNSRGQNQHTPLSVAICRNRVDVVRLLLGQSGIELNTMDHNGHTPLTLAAMKGHEPIAELLLEMEHINLGPDGQGKTPLDFALQFDQLNIAAKLIDAERRRDPLTYNSQTLLSWASENDKRYLVRQIDKISTDNPNLQDREGKTPLSRAAAQGNLAMVRLLLENGAKVVQKDRDSSTPLSRAAENKHKNVVQLLAAKDNVTLHHLVHIGKLQSIEFLLDCNVDVNYKDMQGQTALHTAVIFNQLHVAMTLISRGATIDAEDALHNTPLSLAVRYGHRNLIKLLLSKSKCTRGIKAEDWRREYRHSSSILRISDRVEGGVHVEFIDCAHTFKFRPGTIRSMLQFPDFAGWSSCIRQLGHSITTPSSNRHIQLAKVNKGHETSVLVSLYVPHPTIFLRASDWNLYGIAWTAGEFNEDYTQETKHHYSMLPDGWIPDNDIEFFQQLIVHVTQKWSEFCNKAEEHLSDRRMKQLQEKGSSDIIDELAKDASNLAELRRVVRNQVIDARRLVLDFGRWHGGIKDKRALEAIESFADIDIQLQTLDQTIRDLLQLEFAWVSINEAHKSTSLGTSMKRLSWITFIFLPAMFASSVFGMNVDILERNPDWRWYLLFLGTTLLLTISVWLLFKYSKVEMRIQNYVQHQINGLPVAKIKKGSGKSEPPV